jgi:hypothetical protein
MSVDMLDVSVTFDAERGYVATVAGMPAISALSLSMLRRRIEERLLPDSVEVRLMLDRSARRERDAQRRGVRRGRVTMLPARKALRCCWRVLEGWLLPEAASTPRSNGGPSPWHISAENPSAV